MMSWWALAADLLTARVLVWIARAGRDVELTPETHLFFADRYEQLALYYRRRGEVRKTRQFERKAREHFRDGGGLDGPPHAAAMAMPRPRQYVRLNAVGRRPPSGSNDAASV